MALRLALATPFFIVVGLLTWWRGKRSGTLDLPPLLQNPGLYIRALAVGVLGYWLASYTDFAGLESLSPQFERLILFTYPLFVILFGAAFFAQPFRLGAIWTFCISYLDWLCFRYRFVGTWVRHSCGCGLVHDVVLLLFRCTCCWHVADPPHGTVAVHVLGNERRRGCRPLSTSPLSTASVICR